MHAMFWLFQEDRDSLKGRKADRRLLLRVLRFARPHRRALVIFMALLLLGAGVSTVPGPLLYRAIIDRAIRQSNRDLLVVLSIVLLAALLIGSVIDLVQRLYSARIGESLIYDLRMALFDHVQRMPIAFFTASQTGSLISRLNNDVIGAQRALTGTLGTLVSNVFVLLFALVAMLVLEWRLTIVTLLVLPGFVFLARRVGRKLQRITREQMMLNAAMNSQMTERFNVSGAMLVKLFGSSERESSEFGSAAGAVRDAGVRGALYGRILMGALALITGIGTVFVYLLGGNMVISGDISIGTIIAFVGLTGSAYGPLIQLTNARVDLLTSLVSFERVFELLDLPNPITDAPDATTLVDARGEIAFDHVTFTYPAMSETSLRSLESANSNGDGTAHGPALRDVSFTAAPGQMIALVGPSGAGKSTIASLVPRLYDVSDGVVRVDGRDVRELTLDSLRQAIAVVNQDPHLFHDTVRTNLRYARPTATDEEIEHACRRAQIHDLIAGLPNGYDTIVGERGYRFSGGEKQRIAIARALLKDPAIIILDEATSHLDSETESLIQAAFAEALSGRTSLVIAHRLSTVIAADQILVVESGRIVERGTHHELINAGGLYSELYRTQYERSDAASEPSAALPITPAAL